MKKTFIIIFAVAALGLLRYAERASSKSHNLVASSAGSVSSSSQNSPTGSSPTQTPSTYKDGTYTGVTEDNPYGTVQIAVVISGGKIVDVSFLQMPQGAGHTNEVTAAVKPLLKQTTLQAQSGNIEFVSGATSTSDSYQLSLQSALDRAAQG